ncbi:hypothetical protein DVA67_034360 [Solirubrobacter sp. CPCC 204708]|uniref:Uncharacterized protein n=1 Tax=Solirubrobacter deserti TaxID=2282478 RepID=A0ABT4RVR4_9ACTN|nr:hypothetical protein [Solirubrobacter deserti]MBE2321072.1 hypothetical protein [Solirubrobacter deserti]MDA0142565.1 hypothetical protein [Solirubrobacter deserti]
MRRLALISLALLTGCGLQTDPTPTPSPPPAGTPAPLATRTEPALTLTSTDGVRFVPGARRRGRGDLSPAPWYRIGFRDGRVTLRLAGDGPWEQAPCTVDHVEVGPADGELRRVTVWGSWPDGRCPDRTQEIVLDVPGWTRTTVAAPDELDVPDPSRTGSQRVGGISGSAVLQPDHRSIVLRYSHSSCHTLAAATAAVDGRRVRVTVTVGTEPDRTVCASGSAEGHTLVRLPAAAPRATVTVADCRSDRRRCSF